MSVNAIDHKVGSNIVRLRKFRGLTYHDIAIALRCPEADVERHETGDLRVGAERRMRLGQLFGVSCSASGCPASSVTLIDSRLRAHSIKRATEPMVRMLHGYEADAASIT